MKKMFYGLLLVCMAAASCKKDNESTGIAPANVTIQVGYGLDSSKYQLPVKGITIKLTNTILNIAQSAVAPDSGVVHFEGIPAGKYTLEASITIDGATYSTLTGVAGSKDVTFNASQSAQVAAGGDVRFNLLLLSGKVSDWVIKQVYYAGSDKTNGALFRDQFVELYNNSDSVLYADGLLVAQVWGKQNFTGTTNYTLANGQYDWSKAQNMAAGIDANNDYIYTRSILMIPGTGKTYPVQPGTGVVIAQTALNHKAPYVGMDGEEITIKNPALTVDLSGADFEAYYGDFFTTPYASDIDNPKVPNMQVVQYYGKDYVIDNLGRDGYALFRMPDTQKATELPAYPVPTVAAPSGSATKYYQVPVAYILDAVEVQPSLTNDRVPKKLNAQLDAGFTFTPLGSYSSQSVIRKTAATVNGRVKLKDTNNSTEDFTYLPVAQPRGFQ